MFKSKELTIVTVVIAVVVIIAATAGIAFAADQPDSEKGSNKLIARVAEILGISQDKLENAIKQASEELREQKRDSYFQKLIDEGRLTQGQVEEYKQWLEDRPDIPLPRTNRGACMPFCHDQRLPEAQ